MDSIQEILQVPEKMGTFLVVPGTRNEFFNEEKFNFAQFLGLGTEWEIFKRTISELFYVIMYIGIGIMGLFVIYILARFLHKFGYCKRSIPSTRQNRFEYANSANNLALSPTTQQLLFNNQ